MLTAMNCMLASIDQWIATLNSMISYLTNG